MTPLQFVTRKRINRAQQIHRPCRGGLRFAGLPVVDVTG